MKWAAHTLFCSIMVFGILDAACQNDSFHNEARSRDFEAVEEFVNSKRTIPLVEKAYNFTISGDVRLVYAWLDEDINKRALRGGRKYAREDQSTGEVLYNEEGSPPDGMVFKHNVFDVEFNLYLDYRCARSWGVAWLQFDNDAGIWKL